MILKVGDLAILDPQLAVLIDYQRPNTEACSYPEDSMFLVTEFVTIVCGSRSFQGVILVFHPNPQQILFICHETPTKNFTRSRNQKRLQWTSVIQNCGRNANQEIPFQIKLKGLEEPFSFYFNTESIKLSNFGKIVQLFIVTQHRCQ